ncbi:MAG: hypothetical protein ABI467_01490 [Kofleriaceae bacterium]
MIVIVDVLAPVIVAVHGNGNGNATVIVIWPVDESHATAAPSGIGLLERVAN